MSDENTDIFGEDYEEGEVREGINEDESEEQKEDDEDEEGWGGHIQNEIIIPNMNVMAAILGLHPIIAPRLPLEEPPSPGPLSSPSLPRIRRREEVFTQPPPVKSFRNNIGKRIVRERTTLYSYLALKSGEEFHFTEEDGKNIMLNERIEPNRLIRNIISRVPYKMSERLLYLAKFDSEEESDDEENNEKVQRRYFGNLKELVYEAYIKEWRLRFAFKKMLILWRVYKMNKTCEKEVDPITLSEPEKEIYVYDWDNKKKFVFDAKSMATNIETKLMYHEYGFPSPMYPRNPKNNVEFSYKQMVSLYYQLKAHGELRWGFTTLREYNFNKHRWHMYHKSALTVNSIKSSISLLDSSDGRELLLDFIFAKMDELGFRHNTTTYNIYNIAMIRIPTHWYIEKLKSLAISHYEAEHFGHNRTRAINATCIKIFKLHNKFVTDLKNKKIIN
jgi:hypothetical protein